MESIVQWLSILRHKKQQAYSQSNKTTGKKKCKKLLNEVGEIVDYSNFL